MIKKVAQKEYEETKDITELVSGALLYWAEGDKTKGTSFTNSDPKMILFMTRWFTRVCDVTEDKLEARLHIHKPSQEQTAIKYWSQLTGIPKQNFRKSYLKKRGTGHRKNNLPNGIIRVRVCGTGNTDLRYKILKWADLYCSEFNRP